MFRNIKLVFEYEVEIITPSMRSYEVDKISADISLWLRKHLNKHVYAFSEYYPIKYRFKYEEDAMLFQLTWDNYK